MLKFVIPLCVIAYSSGLALSLSLDVSKLASDLAKSVSENIKNIVDSVVNTNKEVVNTVDQGADVAGNGIRNLAMNIPFLLVEDPPGSGNYVRQDLSGTPDETLPIEKEYVKFFFYNRKTNGTQVNITNIKSIPFDPSKETVFLTHGWMNDLHSRMPQMIKDAYLKKHDMNVFIVDWSEIAKRNYINAKFSIVRVGTWIGNFIQYLVDNLGLDVNKLGLVGYCLGAHVSGVAGKVMNGTIDHLTALDPAGPRFPLTASNDKLDSNDAIFVQVIHTCAGLLGYPFAIGDADFWPNGGVPVQPGCDIDLFGSCSHGRSYEFFAESLTGGVFEGNQCDNFMTFSLGGCSTNDIAHMGNDAFDRKLGNFFLNTNGDRPFAKSSA